MVKKARLGGLTTALYLIQFEDDRWRRAKAEVDGEQRWSVANAEGHERGTKQARGHVLRDDLVLTKGTKQDLVEGGRRGDGSVHVDPVLRFQCNRVYEARGGFSGAKYTTCA